MDDRRRQMTTEAVVRRLWSVVRPGNVSESAYHLPSPMPRFPLLLLASALLLFGAAACTQPEPDGEAPPDTTATAQEAGEEEEAELALYMSHMQRWSHKLMLGVEAQNQAVSDFYLHELEETLETVRAEAPTYEGYEIAQLSETLLAPQLDSLRGALEQANWSVVDERLEATVTACNQCHEATDHGFLQVAVTTDNPFAQDFAPPNE